MFEFVSKVHCNWFLMVQLTINRQWLVMSWHWSATSHYLIYVTRLQWIKMCTFCTEAYDAICYSQQPASTASTNVLFSLEISPGYRLTIKMHRSTRHNTSDIQTVRDFSHFGSSSTYRTEALKGHRVVWKIEIYYLIRMTYEWKSMSSGWHNNIVVTHPDEIPISAKSSGWHMVVWYVIRVTYCSVRKSSGWDTARS